MSGLDDRYRSVKPVSIAVLALVALCCGTSLGAAQNRISVGTLTCTANAGLGLTTSLPHRMRCHYVSSWGRQRAYTGVVTEFDNSSVPGSGRLLRWSVLMSTRPARREALVGRYVVATKTGAAGLSVQGKDLVRGSDQSIVLRASSSSGGRAGINGAPGVIELTLAQRAVTIRRSRQHAR